MKIVGYILMVISIIGGIVLLITGIREKETVIILLSFIATIFGVCTSLAVVYAADVPGIEGVVNSARRISDSNSKSIMKLEKELKAATSSIQRLKNELKELKENQEK